MEMCSESGYGVVDGVGGHTEYLRDGIHPESESEKVVEKGVPLHMGAQFDGTWMAGGFIPVSATCSFSSSGCYSFKYSKDLSLEYRQPTSSKLQSFQVQVF